jgi:alpha-beta hydrolase superfamily lysophospholipase
MQDAGREIWLAELNYALCHASKVAAGRPVNLVGYSLGGLLALDLAAQNVAAQNVAFSQDQRQAPSVQRMVLLAPALKPSSLTLLVRPFQWWPSLLVPSLAPERWKAASLVSVRAYRGLRDSWESWRDADYVLPTPTLLIVDPKDELVDATWMTQDENRKRFRDLTVNLFAKEKSGTQPPPAHHMIVDPATMTPRSWQELTTAVTHFLGGS